MGRRDIPDEATSPVECVTVTCQSCKAPGQLEKHTEFGGWVWLKPPPGWWILEGSSIVRCPKCS